MACQGTLYSIPQMLDMARRAGYSGAGQVEIVAHALVESGGCSSAYNPESGAAGILQFLSSTASGVGLQDPYNAQQSFDASFRLSGGSNFRDWTPYEPASDLDAALGQVRAAQGSRITAAAAQGRTAGGSGLLAGKQTDPWGIGQSIANAAGSIGGSFAATGHRLQDSGQVAAGLLVMGVGAALLTWVLLTQTEAGRGLVRGARETGRTAVAAAAVLK